MGVIFVGACQISKCISAKMYRGMRRWMARHSTNPPSSTAWAGGLSMSS